MYRCFKEFCNELFFCGESVPSADFCREIRNLIVSTLEELPADFKPVWFRFHVSDIANQEDLLRNVLAEMKIDFAVSIIGQAPLSGAHAALEAYFVKNAVCTVPEPGQSMLENEPYRQLFFNTPALSSRGSGPQMSEEFAAAEKIITSRGGTIAGNLHRTWIYCRDIDNNYADLVTARKDLFTCRGLVADTHYITSTGIEGLPHPYYRLVKMDSFALFGHQPEQIYYLQALEHLSPTHIYGVTFERGTRITYGDRSSYYISGTASIDKHGQVVHEQDVEKQTVRLLENVEALLADGGAVLSDLAQAVIYLRDPADQELVRKVLEKRLPDSVPRLLVRGSICRPTWLVEMDAIAVNAKGSKHFAPLFN